jgi:hypothetical protein
MCKTYSTKSLDILTMDKWRFYFKISKMGLELHIGPVLFLYWNKEYRNL